MIRTIASLGLAAIAITPVWRGRQVRRPQSVPTLQGTVEHIFTDNDSARSPHEFNDVTGLAFDRAGRVFVADGRDGSLSAFAKNGALLSEVKAAGSGERPFQSPCCLTLANDSTVWIEDSGNRRYLVFGVRDRELIWKLTRPMTTAPSGHRDRVSWGKDRTIVAITSSYSAAANTFRSVRVRVDTLGHVLASDTLREPPDDSLVAVTVSRVRNGTTLAARIVQPFGPLHLRALGPNGELAEAVSSRYSVAWFDESGRRLAQIGRDVDGPLVTAVERQRASMSLDRTCRINEISRSSLPFDVPDRKTPLYNLGFDLDGRLWVERTVVQGAPSEADVYDRRGRWLESVQWPASVDLSLYTVRGDTGLAVVSGPFGTQRVALIRFRRAN